MLDLGSQMADFALPLPAINNNFNHGVIASAPPRSLPARTKLRDLDFYGNRASKLFTYPHALYSAEAALISPDGAVQQRARGETTLFMDSGGFGFIKGTRSLSSIIDLRRDALEKQEALADVGVIVDVPTNCITNNIKGAETFDLCLSHSLDSIDYARRYRTPGKIKLLNIIQGLDNAQARRWYAAVRGGQLDGYGFAGKRRKDVRLILELLVEMMRDREIDGTSWFHVFGTNQPGFAVLLTAVQRRLRGMLGADVRISFDSSTSFSVTQARGMIVNGLRSDRRGAQHQTYRVAQKASAIDGSRPWPFGSPLGDRCTVGDFLAQCQPGSTRSGTDTLGQIMLSNHSVAGELRSIILANRLFDMEHGDDWQDRDLAMPWDIHMGVDAINAVFDLAAKDRHDAAIAKARASTMLSIFAGTDSEAEEDER